jgi:hypothetical protein
MLVARATSRLTSISATKAWTLQADDQDEQQRDAAPGNAQEGKGGHGNVSRSL